MTPRTDDRIDSCECVHLNAVCDVFIVCCVLVSLCSFQYRTMYNVPIYYYYTFTRASPHRTAVINNVYNCDCDINIIGNQRHNNNIMALFVCYFFFPRERSLISDYVHSKANNYHPSPPPTMGVISV